MKQFVDICLLVLCLLPAAVTAQDSFRFKEPYDLASELKDYRVVARYPHATSIYTQGLMVHDGKLWESGGLYRKSAIYQRTIPSDEVLYHASLPHIYFAEGLTVFDNRLFLLTWKAGIAFEFQVEELLGQQQHEQQLVPKEHRYEGFGWGLTHNGEHLIVSDGSDRLRFIDPETFEVKRSLPVTLSGRPFYQLNELEWVGGYILANVYQTDFIVAIEPEEGRVRWRLDLSELRKEVSEIKRPFGTKKPEVLNGIAYDPVSGNLLVTGKFWPRLFEIQVIDADK